MDKRSIGEKLVFIKNGKFFFNTKSCNFNFIKIQNVNIKNDTKNENKKRNTGSPINYINTKTSEPNLAMLFSPLPVPTECFKPKHTASLDQENTDVVNCEPKTRIVML